MKVGAVAMPLEFVVAVAVNELANCPEGPEPGAVNVTTRPAIPVPPASLTFTDMAVPNTVVTVADCGAPALTVIEVGATLVSVIETLIDPKVTLTT